MNASLNKYRVWPFSNGTQVGVNSTFVDWYADAAAAVEDARTCFTAEGYAVECLRAEERGIRAASPLAPAVVGKVMMVRLAKAE